jgi:hypothetical protein
MSDNVVVAKWNEIKEVVSALEFDVVKNANGTAAAGVRARKGLRDLKTKVVELIKLTVALDKALKAEKKKAESTV